MCSSYGFLFQQTLLTKKNNYNRMYKISDLFASFAIRKTEVRFSSSQQELLKWMAIVLMVLDHVGFFLEQYAWLRYVGRVVYAVDNRLLRFQFH